MLANIKALTFYTGGTILDCTPVFLRPSTKQARNAASGPTGPRSPTNTVAARSR